MKISRTGRMILRACADRGFACLDNGSILRSARKLERMGMITITPHQYDPPLLTLTAAGRAALEAAQ